jgi:hypothetical protein
MLNIHHVQCVQLQRVHCNVFVRCLCGVCVVDQIQYIINSKNTICVQSHSLTQYRKNKMGDSVIVVVEQQPRNSHSVHIMELHGSDKMRMCKNFIQSGECKWGIRCNFYHGLPPPQHRDPIIGPFPQEHAAASNPTVCRHWMRGFCELSTLCRFSHPVNDVVVHA